MSVGGNRGASNVRIWIQIHAGVVRQMERVGVKLSGSIGIIVRWYLVAVRPMWFNRPTYVYRYTVGMSDGWIGVGRRKRVGAGVSNRSFDTQWGCRAFGFEEREVRPTCVLQYTVGLSGVLNRSFDVCVCVTKEVRALVGNDSCSLSILLQLQFAWLAYLDYEEWRGRLPKESHNCFYNSASERRSTERSSVRSNEKTHHVKLKNRE